MATLAALTLFTTGQHYGKHSISGLGPTLMATLQVERTKYAFLFSLEQIPGILLPALGGLCLVYLPLSPTATLLAAALLFAAILCARAVDALSYDKLLLGRTLFGGAEGLMSTVQGALIARTFRHSRVSTAFGFMLFTSRLSSFAGLTVPTLILQEYSLSTAMWVSAVCMVVPLIATLAHMYVAPSSPDTAAAEASPPAPALRERVRALSVAAWRETCRLRAPFWIVTYTFMTVASTTFTFVHFAPDVFDGHVPGIDATRASLLSGLLFLAAGLASPLVGVTEDLVGNRPALLLGASVCSTIGLGICAAVVSFPDVLGARCSLLAMFFLMISLCVAPVTLLSCIAVVVPPSAIPLALGLYKSIENSGLAVVHVVVGRLRDWQKSYISPLIFLSVLAASAIPPLLTLGRLAPELRMRTVRKRQAYKTVEYGS